MKEKTIMAKDSQIDPKPIRMAKSNGGSTITEGASKGRNNSNRDHLIAEVKNKYSQIASSESQQHFYQTTTNMTPEAYYENLLSKAINEINRGTFDNFKSGEEIVNAIANDKTWLSSWK